MEITRACLKHHSRCLHAPRCGIVGPNLLRTARCAAFIWPQSPTKREAHPAEGMFQTCSGTNRPVTGRDLKLIAAAAMLIDHTGIVLLRDSIFYWLCRAIGRLSFPLYCFLLAEGFMYTRDGRRYAKLLLLFALLSEIPFDLALCGKIWYAGSQNVYVTLFLGVCMMASLDRLRESEWKRLAAVGVFCAAAEAVRCDYGAAGMILIGAFYYACCRREPAGWAAAGATALLLSQRYLGSGILSLLFIRFYRGERGRIQYKYAWYGLYPLHLLILYGLSLFMR